MAPPPFLAPFLASKTNSSLLSAHFYPSVSLPLLQVSHLIHSENTLTLRRANRAGNVGPQEPIAMVALLLLHILPEAGLHLLTSTRVGHADLALAVTAVAAAALIGKVVDNVAGGAASVLPAASVSVASAGAWWKILAINLCLLLLSRQ